MKDIIIRGKFTATGLPSTTEQPLSYLKLKFTAPMIEVDEHTSHRISCKKKKRGHA